MSSTIDCYNLKQISRVRKIDPASIGAVITPRLLGIPINEYAIMGMTSLGKSAAHVIIQDPNFEDVNAIQFRIMKSLLNSETEWPKIIVIAPEETNQALKKTFPIGDVTIFSPGPKQSLSMYDIFRDEGGIFAALISDRHLFS